MSRSGNFPGMKKQEGSQKVLPAQPVKKAVLEMGAAAIREGSVPFLFGAQKETGPSHQRKRRAGSGRNAPSLAGDARGQCFTPPHSPLAG